jgi:DNA-directed RNA polymerase subunit N (RpoN/RPB10)
MLYYKCPTCRTVLANRQLLFEAAIKSISDNNNLSETQQYDEKIKILSNLMIHNLCCRMRMLTYIKKIEIVK